MERFYQNLIMFENLFTSSHISFLEAVEQLEVIRHHDKSNNYLTSILDRSNKHLLDDIVYEPVPNYLNDLFISQLSGKQFWNHFIKLKEFSLKLPKYLDSLTKYLTKINILDIHDEEVIFTTEHLEYKVDSSFNFNERDLSLSNNGNILNTPQCDLIGKLEYVLPPVPLLLDIRNLIERVKIHLTFENNLSKEALEILLESDKQLVSFNKNLSDLNILISEYLDVLDKYLVTLKRSQQNLLEVINDPQVNQVISFEYTVFKKLREKENHERN